MADIVNLDAARQDYIEEETRLVYVCDCGCSTFSLIDDGSAECAHCGAPANAASGGWMSSIEHAPMRAEGASSAFRSVRGNGSVDFVRARLVSIAQEEETDTIIVGQRDGEIALWTDSSEERYDQLFRHIESIERMIDEIEDAH